MRNVCLMVLVAFFLLCVLSARVSAHCEIPCGIYDDEARIDMLVEHITTIEKSMKQIMKLEAAEQSNLNQLVRWIMNKERHADELQEIVTQYFMTQRIKADTAAYGQKLGLLHQMLVHSMKCKQTTDLEHVAKLRHLVDEFGILYFGQQE